MANLRRDFTKGKMNLDADERLLPEGEFRRAENINIVNSEGSNVGSIRKSFSNKKLTNINFGSNVKCTLGFADEIRDKIYWFVTSSLGCYLLEWDNINQVVSVVLEDTRPLSTIVLNLNENLLITGIGKIITDDYKKDLLIWSNDEMEPCCINIERAKTYGANNFDLEDILLIKKPPTHSPSLFPLNISGLTNNLEERFFSFSYRYKYLDGEYSALSTYANYSFNPKDFDIDYYTLDNKGMVNAFNAVRVSFNTGDKRVTDIQLVFKESNSNNLYIIDTFNKQKEGWIDNDTKSFTFSNEKNYTLLPEKELYRSFDNVPLRAKALTIIDNTIVFGNYTEGRDIVDENGNKINIDYDVSMINEPIEDGDVFTKAFPTTNQISFTNPTSIALNLGNKIVFNINLFIDTTNSYDNNFYYILPQDYNTLDEVFTSLEFIDFLAIIDADIKNNFTYTVPDEWIVSIYPSITYSLVSGVSTFTISPVTFIDTTDSSVEVRNFIVSSSSYLSITVSSNSSSLKTNRDYQVGVIYEDDACRKTTVLTTKYNSIYIPQLYSTFKNRLKININNKPPFWAKRFRVVVKSPELDYQTIYINRFYNEDFFVWAKLEAENKDKVSVGDILIVKKAPNAITTPIKVKVLEIKSHDKDFITGNNDENGNPIVEEAGLYIKIRPEGFSMDFRNYDVYQREFGDVGARSGFPTGYLDLFTTIGTPNTEVEIPAGSSISLFLNSSFAYRSGWLNATYDKMVFAQRNYNTIEEWFTENIINKNIFITDSSGVTRNYGPNLSLVRGLVSTGSFGQSIFTPDPSGKLYLKIIGLESGGSGGRSGYVRAKIVVRTSTGFYAFETEPKKTNSEIYFESSQTFDIVNGNHNGNIQNQDVSSLTPASIDLDFFNCYTQGNGVESYRVRDGFNTRFLNIDLRPTATSVEEYKQVTRFADLTYGKPFIESSNINGLNEFNIATANFKELDKQYGSIQKLHSRDTNIYVFQEEKTSKILFNKALLYYSDGSANPTASKDILGDQVPYLGENGIGLNPESFSHNDYQIYYANPKRSILQRLSIDGVEDIVNGMVDWFRDIFISRPNAKMLGGFDPYHKQYFFSIGDNVVKPFSVGCGNVIYKLNIDSTFNYEFELNGLVGNAVLNYNITLGNATITANYDGNVFVASNVTGVGTITIPITDITKKTINISVVPVGGAASYQIANSCPIGIAAKLVTIVVNDAVDAGKTITNRYKWDSSNFFAENDLLQSDGITRFSTFIGLEGVGPIPLRNTIVNLQSFKDVINDGDFSLLKCNRIGYLISNVVYSESDINTILSAATFISLSNLANIYSGNFLFNKTANNQILYLVWDYTNRSPQVNDDTVSVLFGASDVTIDVLDNDTYVGSPGLVIITPPTNGTATINVDNTITYAVSGGIEAADSFTYQVGSGSCVSTATVYISVFEGFTFDNFSYGVDSVCFDIKTNDGSTRDFNYELGISKGVNNKSFTRTELNGLGLSKVLNAPLASTPYTDTGIITVEGSYRVCMYIISSPVNSALSAVANCYFKEIGSIDNVMELEYNYTP